MTTEKKIKRETAEDPILLGDKIWFSDETPVEVETMETAVIDDCSLDAPTEPCRIYNAETRVEIDGRTVYVHEIAYRSGTRFSVSENSILDIVRPMAQSAAPVKLSDYFKTVNAVRCLQAFGGTMVPMSRFYWYYRRLEKAVEGLDV